MKGRQSGVLSLVLLCWESVERGSAPDGLSRDAYGCALPALAWGTLGAKRGLQMFVLW